MPTHRAAEGSAGTCVEARCVGHPLVHDQPISGYDIRKILSETPMRRFSASPGSIYPALRRLGHKHCVRERRDSGSRRQRATVSITATGKRELHAWLSAPLTQDEVANRTEEVMLRLAFLHLVPGQKSVADFLREFHELASAQAQRVRRFFEEEKERMPWNARLALEYGTRHFEHLAEWSLGAAQNADQRDKLE